MKKKLLLLSIILVSLTNYAQARFGIRAGANFADLTNLETTKKPIFTEVFS